MEEKPFYNKQHRLLYQLSKWRMRKGAWQDMMHLDEFAVRSGAVADFLCDYLGLDREKFDKENNIYPNAHVKNVLRRVAGMTCES